jgi:hypothetical protein
MSLDGTRRQISYTYHIREPGKGCRTIAAANTEFEPGLLRRRQRRLDADNVRGAAIREVEDDVRRRLRRRGYDQ